MCRRVPVAPEGAPVAETIIHPRRIPGIEEEEWP